MAGTRRETGLPGRHNFFTLLQWRMPLPDSRYPRPDTGRVYADVIVPRHIGRPFTYLVPRSLCSSLTVGHRVRVPFGHTTVEAVVIGLHDQRPAEVRPGALKEIHTIVSAPDEGGVPSSLLELSRRISQEYVAPWGQSLRLILPRRPGAHRAIRYVATEPGRSALVSGYCPEHLRSLLTRIARRSAGVLAATLQSDRGLKTLTNHGWIRSSTEPEKITTKPRRPLSVGPDMPLDGLPEADPVLLDRLAAGIRRQQAATLVVQGTWETRLGLLTAAVGEARAAGKSVIIIVGEAARAAWLEAQIVRGIRASIMSDGDRVTVGSSSTRPGMKGSDGPRMIVGTRSALFTPLRSVGLIWVDQEDDPALKELQEPRYHARDVARMRGAIDHTLVVLASSHPSLESITDPSVEVHSLPEASDQRPFIEVADLRLEPAGTLLTSRLLTAVREAVAKRAGILLFLNRKGYAGALVCRECGWVPRCSSCAVAFTYYREALKLGCRYCGLAEPLPDACPMCLASRLAPVGEGTERAYLEVQRLFPYAKVARLDGDTLRHSATASALWQGVRAGAFDIVIGTQVLFQREPLPRMGLVGILYADSGLHVPDFRAAERTYHLLTDAVDTAKPRHEGGRVLIQTLLPTHHAIEAVVSGKPGCFYEEELSARRLLGYPPACHVVSLSVIGLERRLVETAAMQWRQGLDRSTSEREGITLLGPVPALGGRPKGRHRFHLLAKGLHRETLLQAVRDSAAAMESGYKRGRLKFVVDVDPVDMH